MNYYAKLFEWNTEMKRTAGTKAREDVDDILEKAGYIAIEIPTFREGIDISFAKRLSNLRKTSGCWEKATKKIKKGDVLVIQFPLTERYLLFPNLIRRLKKRGVIIVTLLHDIDILRRNADPNYKEWKKKAILRDEQKTLKECDVIIAHNERMKTSLVEMGFNAEKIVELEIFDYLTTESSEKSTTEKKGVVIAGNLVPEKAGYAYQLPDAPEFHLYGPGYSNIITQDNIKYYGSFEPDILPQVLEGKYGLVWDGPSAETCEGFFGQYLKYNNPHKTSLYLAAGLPPIVWKESAMASFIERNKCGLIISSLHDIDNIDSNLDNEEYKMLRKNAAEIGEKLKKGYYTLQALQKAGIVIKSI